MGTSEHGCRRAAGRIVAIAVAAVWLGVGCTLSHLSSGSGPSGEQNGAPDADVDALSDAAAGLDADDAPDRPCDPQGRWEAPVAVTPLNVVTPAGGARVSSDLLTMYFHAGAPLRLFAATRKSPEATFMAPAPLEMVGGQDAGSANIKVPAAMPNELGMFFEESGGGGAKIVFAGRANRTDPFGAPVPVTELAAAANTGQPFVRGDGSEIYFTSRRSPAVGGSTDIFRAKLSGANVVGTIEHLAELQSAVDERSPVVSADGLTIYFGSLKDNAGPSARYHVWTATRADDRAPFGVPVLEESLDSTGSSDPSWISDDGCTMYLSSSRDGDEKIYVSVRAR
jgi:hypothetical protein